MYRATALHLADSGIDPDDRAGVAAAVRAMPLRLVLADRRRAVELAGRDPGQRLRRPEVSALTSRIAVHPEVRQRLVALQQEFVRRHGGVMEGRDIGTVVAPETPFKFYLDADPGVRAERRHAELARQGAASDQARSPASSPSATPATARAAYRPSRRLRTPARSTPASLSPDEVVEAMLAEIRRRSGR